jgi:RNA polymerase sigma factor (sigma-70 family)
MPAPLDLLVSRLRGQVRRAGTSEDDAALLAAFIQSRDESAFEAIVRRHGPMVLGVCHRALGGADGAEDAFQAVFLVLARKARDVEPVRLAGWLHSVALRAASEVRRSANRRRRREMPMSNPPERSTSDPGPWEDLRAILDEEIAGLPEPQRQAVVLCDLEGLTRREAAARLGIGDGTLSHRLSTAHERLARRLTSRGIALSATALASLIAQNAQAAPLQASMIQAVVSGLVTPYALTLSSTLVKAMMSTKLSLIAGALATALALGVGGMMASARPPASDKDAEPGGPRAAAAALLKAHVEGRIWVIEAFHEGKKALDLAQRPAMAFGVINLGPGGVIEPQLPDGALRGLPVDSPAVMVNGKPAKLSDLKPGMYVALEAAPGKAAVRRITAFSPPAGEVFTLKAVDKKRRTVQLASKDGKAVHDAVPLAKEAEVRGYMAPAMPPGGMGGAIEIKPPMAVAASLDDLKPGTPVSAELAFEGERLVIKKLSFIMK